MYLKGKKSYQNSPVVMKTWEKKISSRNIFICIYFLVMQICSNPILDSCHGYYVTLHIGYGTIYKELVRLKSIYAAIKLEGESKTIISNYPLNFEQ